MKEIKKDDPISKEIPLEKPLKTSSRLGREAKIGVTVILLLTIVFGVVVVRRISGSKREDQAMIPPPAPEEESLGKDSFGKDKGPEKPLGEGRPNFPPKDGKKLFLGAGQANVVQPESSKLGLGGDPLKHHPGKGGKFDRPEKGTPPENPPLFPSTPKSDPALADNPPKPHHTPTEDPLGAPKVDTLAPHEPRPHGHQPKPNDDVLAMIPPAPNGAAPPQDGGFPPPNPRREPQSPRHGEFGDEHREANESLTNIAVMSDPPPAPQSQSRYGNSVDMSSQPMPPNPNREPESRWDSPKPAERPQPSELARRDPPRKPPMMDDDRGFDRPGSFDRPGKGPNHREPMGPPREDGKYEIQPNDSYWTISKKVYRTDGYFKALAEYNRSKGVDGDHLKPGELIETPSIAQLEQKYPELCPKATHRETPQQGKYQSVGMTQSAHGSHTYTVVEGDTLFNIARYELGKASRWAEIYDLNREVLGRDFNYLVPGTQLRLPQDSKSEKSDMQARQAGNAWK
jgi:nucleoid-associated protein YgaU